MFFLSHIINLSADQCNPYIANKSLPVHNVQKGTHMEYTFTKENFEEEVMNSPIPVMIDFYADWCGPCKMMGPVVEKLAEKYEGKVKIGKVNSDNEPELSERFQVMSIPDIVFLKDGKIKDQSIGAVPQKVLESKIEKLL